MIQKIYVGQAELFCKKLAFESYYSNPYLLAYGGYYDDEYGYISEQDMLYRNDFPCIGLPKKIELWRRLIADYISEEDISEIRKNNIPIKNNFPVGEEFYYKTKDFINLESKSMKQLKKSCKAFEQNYTFKLLNKYPQKKLLAFLDKWENTQNIKNEFFETARDYENFCIEKCKNINGKWLFIEINGELAGYNLSYQVNENFWIGIQQKVDYKYKGLSRFLLHKRACQFPKTDYFSLGMEARDDGIKIFKESLHPFKKIKRYYVITE